MTATKEGEDSSIQRMIKLVKSTDPGNAKIVSIADRWATWIVVIALLAAAGTYAVAGEIIRAVTILVVFCLVPRVGDAGGDYGGHLECQPTRLSRASRQHYGAAGEGKYDDL
nr:hypothetical protein [Veillonella denticariosi]